MNFWLRASAFALALCAAPAIVGAASVPSGLRSTGTIVVQANVSGQPLTAGGNIALYRRDNRYRLDLLSFGFPGTDPAMSAVFGALIPAGGATVLYDGTDGSLTLYSNANHAYYTEAPHAAAAPPTPVAAQTPNAGRDPLAALAVLTRQLHDVQSASVFFTGHSMLNGHPVANLDILLKRHVPGKALEDYHATLALADDLNGFPVRILFSSTPPTKDAFGGSLRIDLTSVQSDTPDDATFAVPAGYARVNSMSDVLKPH